MEIKNMDIGIVEMLCLDDVIFYSEINISY
jgi:hypothetical protein